MQPGRLSILGVGLLGGSIGLAAKSAVKSCRVIGYGHRRASLETAQKMGAVDEIYDSPAESVRGADLVILCTPVGVLPQMLQAMGPALKPEAVVTDVGSTKATVVSAAKNLLPKTAHFIGSHPMAGSEKRGVEFARADLTQGALCIVTPDESSEPAALEKVESFWRLIGMRTTRLTPAEHDRRLGDVSHLPHAVAAALVAMQDPASFELSGKGFADATRIAAGDGGLWRDILLDNRENVLASIGKLNAQLGTLEKLLRAGDGEGVRAWLDDAAARRAKLNGNG
jgi:prephenate dehydrogenase